MKKYIFALAVLALSSMNTFAESYDVNRIYDGGYSYLVSLNTSTTPSTSGFSLTINPATQVATFSFSTPSESTMPTASCQAGAGITIGGQSTMDVYYKALELSHDLGLIQSFYLHTGVIGTCSELANVVYRSDVKRVNVTCANGTTSLGQSVYISGSTARLGNWNTGGAVKLNPSFYPKWTGDVIVENNTSIQWKCLKRQEDNPSQGIVWQAGANNLFNSATTSSVSAQF